MSGPQGQWALTASPEVPTPCSQSQDLIWGLWSSPNAAQGTGPHVSLTRPSQPLPQGHLSRASLQLPRPYPDKGLSKLDLYPSLSLCPGLGLPWLWQGCFFSSYWITELLTLFSLEFWKQHLLTAWQKYQLVSNKASCASSHPHSLQIENNINCWLWKRLWDKGN